MPPAQREVSDRVECLSEHQAEQSVSGVIGGGQSAVSPDLVRQRLDNLRVELLCLRRLAIAYELGINDTASSIVIED